MSRGAEICSRIMDSILFLPLRVAQGRHVLIRAVAFIVYPFWGFLMLFPIMPFLFAAILLEAWADLKETR